MTRTETISTEQNTTVKPELSESLRHIVLTGFMGAGKSTVGRLLAARIGWKFIDLDHHLESRARFVGL